MVESLELIAERIVALDERPPAAHSRRGMFIGHIITHLVLGESKAGQFFGAAMILLVALALPILSALGLSALAWGQLSKESAYRQRHGVEWQAHYEAEQGSLTEARIKVAVEVVGAVVVMGIGIWLYRMILPALRGEGYASHWSSKRRKRKRSRHSAKSPPPQTTTASTIAPVQITIQPESPAPPKIGGSEHASST